ncbi:Ankyrin repeat domain-containing protein 2 Skeletal muscle ankyrin repeat protein [Channa argus]|uniref:Ankyrin repeat domain-containing protein 2 Skeletal muscle ankyrin repeat protein n=1 Tax=Channa argus TaxID=215402 RepID=A0A6G1R0G7_CHAAH|nr:Ankyrin repeat domain-containing protein 2 Skeletal muscle ankyrin repeat protein [Channa argus]
MEDIVQSAARAMDFETGVVNKAQTQERVQRITSDIHCEILHLNGGENIAKLCKAKKTTKKTYTAMVSVKIPATGTVATAEFMNAASQGKVNIIEKYLADGGNPNVHDELKRTALHRASVEGHAGVVQMLLEKGADINFKDRLGSRAIHWACRGGSLGVVKVLKNHGADLNIRDKLYSTPLHVATRTGHITIVEYLLSSGAKINSRDRHMLTMLQEGVTAVQEVKQWQFDVMETLQRLEKLRDVGLMPPENNSREQ